MLHDDTIDDAKKQAVINFITAAAVDRNVQLEFQKSVEEDKQRDTSYLTTRLNRSTGTLIRANIKGSDSLPVYVIDGLTIKDATEQKNGKPFEVDVENSDESVYYIDDYGKTQVTTADSFEVLGNVDLASALSELESYGNEQLIERRAAIDAEVASYFYSQDINSNPATDLVVGDTAESPDGAITQIMEINEDGSVLLEVESPDGEISEAIASRDELPKFGFNITDPGVNSKIFFRFQWRKQRWYRGLENVPQILPKKQKELHSWIFTVIETGKDVGMVDQVNLHLAKHKVLEYEYGKDRALDAAEKSVKALTTELKKGNRS